MDTIVQLFEDSVMQYANNYYLYEKTDGEYKGITYEQVRAQVYKFAAGLISMGVEKGDRIALLSEGRNNWVIAELGILYTGAINIPLSVLLNEKEELAFRLKHSGAKMIVVSGRHAGKLKELQNELPELEKVILFETDDRLEKKEILYNDVLKSGEGFMANNPGDLEIRWHGIEGNDYANICYTSGTTADPKGIILTHRNYTANVEQSMSIIRIPPSYTTLLILPWDHAFAHTAGVYTIMKLGASFASVHAGKTMNETRRNIPINIKEIKPHFLMSVPALAKNFRKNIEKSIREKGNVIRVLFNFGLKLAYAYNGDGYRKGRGVTLFYKPLIFLFDKIIFKKVREGFGGRIKFFIGGGALLDIELQRFFYALGMPMFQGYGLTEAAPVISANTPDKHKMGSSGILVHYLDLKICNEDGKEVPTGEKGEIIVKGENVMAGYWKNEEATKEAVKNEWLHTGDMGYMDNDGFLYVLGRFKSLLIGDDGEKFSPEGIEEALADNSELIEQCMLYNNQHPYTTALLYPNPEALKRKLKENFSDLKSEEAVIEAIKLLEAELKLYRTGNKFEDMFPQRWLPASVGILPEGFNEDNHMLNSTMKVVRGKITDVYEEKIQYMYTPEGKNLYNKGNIDIMRKLLN